MRRLRDLVDDPNRCLCFQHRSSRVGGSRRQGTRDGQCRGVDAARDVPEPHRSLHIFGVATKRGPRFVPRLPKPAIASERAMSPLRKWVASTRGARPYLTAVLVVAVLIGDVTRAADRQLLAREYVFAVRAYQNFGSPLLAPHVRCRYRPTCSEFSVQAVQRFGLVRGMALSLRRVASCTTRVAAGTVDLVPEE